MKFDYLMNDEPKHLAAFFNPMVASVSFGCVWFLTFLMVLFWPKSSLVSFIKDFRIPLAYLGTFTCTMLVHSYLSLRMGLGEMHPDDYFARLERRGLRLFEEENNFVTYGLIEFILHTLFMMFLTLPLLILAAAFSGIIPWVFLKSLVLIFTASLICRTFSFLMYLCLGQWSKWARFFSRSFFVLFFLLTLAFARFANPIFNLFLFHLEPGTSLKTPDNTYFLYIMIVTGLILTLTLISQIIIRRRTLAERSV
ncbi:MAG: hypothetical protein JRD68_00675 [Deltaproteobacteria bacterium]|nr:hypothetical protein [Deltaproteobacteria bacterium]